MASERGGAVVVVDVYSLTSACGACTCVRRPPGESHLLPDTPLALQPHVQVLPGGAAVLRVLRTNTGKTEKLRKA